MKIHSGEKPCECVDCGEILEENMMGKSSMLPIPVAGLTSNSYLSKYEAMHVANVAN